MKKRLSLERFHENLPLVMLIVYLLAIAANEPAVLFHDAVCPAALVSCLFLLLWGYGLFTLGRCSPAPGAHLNKAALLPGIAMLLAAALALLGFLMPQLAESGMMNTFMIILFVFVGWPVGAPAMLMLEALSLPVSYSQVSVIAVCLYALLFGCALAGTRRRAVAG